MMWTQMFFAKFFHRPAEVQRVLLVSEPIPFSEINPRITKVLQAWSAVFSGGKQYKRPCAEAYRARSTA
jgi:hypothetical protein